MAQKSWTLSLPEGQHTVQLETGNWTWRTTVLLDGQPVPTPRVWLFNPHRVIPVPVPGHDVAIHIRSNGFTYTYDLVVDGRSLTSGLPAVAPPPTPTWAWIFAGACLLLLILGGACGGGLGLAGCSAAWCWPATPANPWPSAWRCAPGSR